MQKCTVNGVKKYQPFDLGGIVDKDQKEWIDTASYYALMNRWRFSKSGDPIFQGEAGDYYKKVMTELRQKVGNAEHVRVSKNLGFSHNG